MQAFANLRVIDLTHVLAGPFCTYQLAALGADVIKVEPPTDPDISRANGHDADSGLGSDFAAQNANKRAVSIDLKTAAGKQILRRLLAGADVMVENYRSGALAALGFGYPAVKAIRGDIIYCSITGFGQRGELATRTAYDNVIQARSGLMAASGEPGAAPMKVGPPVLDYGTGTHAAFAIAAALYRRSVTGRGQHLDVAMLDAALMLMSSHLTRQLESGAWAPPSGNDSTTNAGYCCYATGHGLLMLGAFNATQHKRLWAHLGDPAHGEMLARLPLSALADHLPRDRARLAEIFARKTADEWETELNRAHIPAAAVRRLDQALADPHLQNRAVLQDIDGRRLPVAAFRCADGEPSLSRPPPSHGQHTREVLREIGYDEEELLRLQRCGAIALGGGGSGDTLE